MTILIATCDGFAETINHNGPVKNTDDAMKALIAHDVREERLDAGAKWEDLYVLVRDKQNFLVTREKYTDLEVAITY